MSDSDSFVEVFAGDAIEAPIVQSFLESNGIAAQLDGENIGVTASFLAAGGGAGAVKVMVQPDDADEARRLIAERQKNN